jgi:hypothetical protein
LAELTSERPVLDQLASMTADSVEASSLDPETLMLVRIAALAAVDAPPISYPLQPFFDKTWRPSDIEEVT